MHQALVAHFNLDKHFKIADFRCSEPAAPGALNLRDFVETVAMSVVCSKIQQYLKTDVLDFVS